MWLWTRSRVAPHPHYPGLKRIWDAVPAKGVAQPSRRRASELHPFQIRDGVDVIVELAVPFCAEAGWSEYAACTELRMLTYRCCEHLSSKLRPFRVIENRAQLATLKHAFETIRFRVAWPGHRLWPPTIFMIKCHAEVASGNGYSAIPPRMLQADLRERLLMAAFRLTTARLIVTPRTATWRTTKLTLRARQVGSSKGQPWRAPLPALSA